MLEILLLIFLCKRLGTMLRAKGRSAGWFQVLLVVCWFGGEFVCALAMMVITQNPNVDATIYIGALLGAAGGAIIVFVIAHHLAPLNVYDRPTGGFPVAAPGQPGGPPPAPPI